MIWNMVRQGLFGQIMHVEGGYQKDAGDWELRLPSRRQLAWQGEFRQSRLGNVNPTHDLGPLALWLDIHRGDRFDYLVSMGGAARRSTTTRRSTSPRQYPGDHPLRHVGHYLP